MTDSFKYLEGNFLKNDSFLLGVADKTCVWSSRVCLPFCLPTTPPQSGPCSRGSTAWGPFQEARGQGPSLTFKKASKKLNSFKWWGRERSGIFKN